MANCENVSSVHTLPLADLPHIELRDTNGNPISLDEVLLENPDEFIEVTIYTGLGYTGQGVHYHLSSNSRPSPRIQIKDTGEAVYECFKVIPTAGQDISIPSWHGRTPSSGYRRDEPCPDNLPSLASGPEYTNTFDTLLAGFKALTPTEVCFPDDTNTTNWGWGSWFFTR